MDETDDFGDAMEEEGEEGEEEELDPNNPEHAFLILEKQYTKTVVEIEQNPEIAQYVDEYNKLFEALYDTYSKERELRDKYTELEETDAENVNQLEVAMKVIQSDEETIAQLKDQLENAWKLADNAHAREQAAQEIIDNLRKQIAGLNAEIDLKNRMGQENSEEMGQLSKHKEGLQREKEKLLNEVAQLATKLTNAMSYQEELERKNSAADLKINEIAGQLEDQGGELERQKRLQDKMDQDMADLNKELETKNEEIAGLNGTIGSGQRQIAKLETQLREHKAASEKMGKESEAISSKHTKLLDDFNSLSYHHDELKKEMAKKSTELKVRQEEAAHLRNDLNKAAKARETQEKKIMKAEGDKNDVIIDREKLRQVIANMEREIEQNKKQADLDKRSLDGMQREKEILSKNLLRQQAVGRDHVKLIKIQEQSKRKLELEIDEFHMENNRQKKQIGWLEQERDRMVEEQLDLTSKIENLMDDMKLKKAEVYDLKKTLAENDNRLRMQQNLFEAVRAERNGLQKALQESNAVCGELKGKLKISSHQSEQLKEDIAMKEQLLIKEENILRKVNKEKENLRAEVNSGLEQIKSLKGEIAEMMAEEKRLHKVIMEGDRLIRDQAKDLEQLMNERDILGSQLVRRNDELALLYEKIRILQTTLHRGEAQYDQRLEDIKLLKVEIRRLRQDKSLLTKSINNMTDLRQEIFHLERDLTRERLKCRALEEELQNPINVHRWRKLEGSDPELLELLQKINLLQKRLLQLTSEGIERERQLRESERLYCNLRQVLARQPGPEIKEELTQTKRALSLRGNKLKCLVSELNMTELQASEYKTDLEKVTNELREIKRKYLFEKKAKSQRLEALQVEPSKETNPSSSQIKFTGGGFRMSISGSVNN